VVLLRMHGDAAHQAETVRRALQRVMPGQYYVTTQVFRETVDEKRAPWAFGATMFTVLGVLALLVAAVGLYALIAYGVAQRMHELGVRVALGAQRRHIMTLIISRGLAFAATGAAMGVAAALVAGRAAAGLLFRESPRDPVVFVAVTILMLLVATIASAVPARRASHADPNTALRAE
jgi:ABC-type antimicrobial peptide transport system permease subunit